jgi:hypothetical protein
VASPHIATTKPALSECGLTPRSRRGPTAKHQARRRLLSIMPPPGLALHRRSHLTSNVRPCLVALVHFVITARPSGLASRTPPLRASARPLRPLLSVVACTAFGRGCACLQSRFVGLIRLHDVRTIFSYGAVFFALRTHGARTALLRLRCLGAPCTLPPAGRPNSSVNARPNGGALGPRSRVLHHRLCGPSTPPPVPRYLER